MRATILIAVGSFALTPTALTAQQQPQPAVTAEVRLGTGVENREPVGVAEAFPADVGQIYAWTRITGAANTTVEHVWRFGEHEFVVPLTIGGSPWRTWSIKTIPPEWDGEWTFEVRDASGNVVSSVTFTVGDM
jgi:hypothetical protein